MPKVKVEYIKNELRLHVKFFSIQFISMLIVHLCQSGTFQELSSPEVRKTCDSMSKEGQSLSDSMSKEVRA